MASGSQDPTEAPWPVQVLKLIVILVALFGTIIGTMFFFGP
jgi:hypothetical protein